MNKFTTSILALVATVTAGASAAYADDPRRDAMKPVVQAECDFIGIGAACTWAMQQGKNGMRARRYPQQAQPSQAPQQPTDQAPQRPIGPPGRMMHGGPMDGHAPGSMPVGGQRVLQQYPVNYGPAQPQVLFGNVCTAPDGWFAPGQVRPLGAYCQVATPYGIFVGQITR